MLLLQRVPYYTAGIPATTCRHLQCPYEDAVFQAGDFILSLEKPERCNPSRNPLSYKAIACLSEVLYSGWNHQKGKRGLGERGEERWHVTCFESLCREIRKRELLINPGDGIPSWAPAMEFGHHIITDERRIPAYPGKFNVDSPYQFGLELWKATQLFDDRQAHGAHFMPTVPPHIQLPEKLIDGRDGQSLYLTNAARNFRGEMPWGEIAEISAADVRGVTLYEMTRRVSAMMRPKYQARRASEKQEELARKAREEIAATAASPNQDDILAAGEKGDEALTPAEHNSNASTSDTEAVLTPMNRSATPETASVTAAAMNKDDVAESSDRAFDVSEINKPTPDASINDGKLLFVPGKEGYTTSQAVRAMGKTTHDIATTSENKTNNRMPSQPTSPKQNIVVPTEVATSLAKPAPSASNPSRISPKRNGQGNSAAQKAATAPEKEATAEDAGGSSEDDVVFLGWNKVAKAAKEPLEETLKGKGTVGRETRRSLRGGRGRWRYRYGN